jgi:hypothetical protein
MYTRSKRQPSNGVYELMDAIAVAVAIDRHQGFVKVGIKVGNSQIDHDSGKKLFVNRTVARRTLDAMYHIKTEPDADNTHVVPIIQPEPHDREKAREIFDHFNSVLLLDKLGDTLIKEGANGEQNVFNLHLYETFSSDKINSGNQLSMIVSLPNSYRMSFKRRKMDEFFATHRDNGFIGELKARVKVTAEIVDIKPIPRYNVNLVTLVTEENKVAKFFVNKKLSAELEGREGETLDFTGYVKRQDINEHTLCQETVFNRIRL